MVFPGHFLFDWICPQITIWRRYFPPPASWQRESCRETTLKIRTSLPQQESGIPALALTASLSCCQYNYVDIYTCFCPQWEPKESPTFPLLATFCLRFVSSTIFLLVTYCIFWLALQPELLPNSFDSRRHNSG